MGQVKWPISRTVWAVGSLRNPVGPLPSSIYWRRRAVLLTVLALLALLIAWYLSSGGGGGDDKSNGSDGKNPVQTITPGPSGSESAITQAPGGRDESGDESGSGGGSGDGDGDGGDGPGDTAGSGGGSGADGGSTGSGGGSGSAGGGAAGSGGSTGEQVPAGSGLPNCSAGSVKLTVRSAENSYSPGEDPVLRLIARNTGGGDCKLDLGPKGTVVRITPSDADDAMWSSAHCPRSAGNLFFRIPAGESVTYTLEWDRRASAPDCATPPAKSAAPDTYLVEAKAPGLAKARASFVLSKD